MWKIRIALAYILAFGSFLVLMFVPLDGYPTNGFTAPAHRNTRMIPIPGSEWTAETKIWLARSCAGEIHFGLDAGDEETEECSAIAWVYSKRFWELRNQGKNVSLLWVIRNYSSAVKCPSIRKRPWLIGLRLDAARPEGWPTNLDWRNYRSVWIKKIQNLDWWASGYVGNPVPKANHYGGEMDAHRAEKVYGWLRLPAPSYFQNRFYNSHVVVVPPSSVVSSL